MCSIATGETEVKFGIGGSIPVGPVDILANLGGDAKSICRRIVPEGDIAAVHVICWDTRIESAIPPFGPIMGMGKPQDDSMGLSIGERSQLDADTEFDKSDDGPEPNDPIEEIS